MRGLIHGEVLTLDPSGRFELVILLPHSGAVQEPILEGTYRSDGDTLVLTRTNAQIETSEQLPPKRLTAIRWKSNRYLLTGSEMVSFPQAVRKRWVREHRIGSIFYQRVGDERTRIEGVPDYRVDGGMVDR